MVAKIYTAALVGLDAQIVEVEVYIRKGIHKFNIVGLPDKAINEAKDRVTSAIRNSNAKFITKRITVNLAPADLPKSGPTYDLPIAVGILVASKQVKFDTSKSIFLGELALDGSIRESSGILSITDSASKLGFTNIFVPEVNAKEAALVKNINVFPVKTFDDLFKYFQDNSFIEKYLLNINEESITEKYSYDLCHVKGQTHAKRALEIAAAGGHNVLLTGTPGSGKTLLAKTLPSFLPKLTLDESLEITRIHSVAGVLSSRQPLISLRPFRSPHHTTSQVALVGGGAYPRPGEISLAHRGVLFLDEFPEFTRSALEALRQPIEDKIVSISRATGTLQFPANFMLIAAMNPCKCGWHGDVDRECTCTLNEYYKYQKRVSGPILDRIDLQVSVQKVKYDKLLENNINLESSIEVKKRVQTARDIQINRYKKIGIISNCELSQNDLQKFIVLDSKSMQILKKAVEKLNLSARGYFRIMRVSRTIADLNLSENIKCEHVGEALSYRLNAE